MEKNPTTPKLKIILTIALLITSLIFPIFLTSPVKAIVPPDVEGTEYEYQAATLNSVGIMTGFPDGEFKPYNDITRAEFSAIAIRTLGLDDIAWFTPATNFIDVGFNHWASGYIDLATDMDLIKGYPDRTFRPENNISNAEAITILIRMLGLGEQVESQGGTWPYNYASRAHSEGLLDRVNISAAANDKTKRGNVAQLLMNTLNTPTWEFIGYDYNNNPIYEKTGQTLIENNQRIEVIQNVLITDIDRIGTSSNRIELSWDDYNEKITETYRLTAEYSPEFLLGHEATVWLKDDREVIHLELNQENIIYDTVINDDGNLVELKSTSTTYSWAEDPQIYINYESKRTGDLSQEMYGKFLLDNNNEIMFATVFEFESDWIAGYVIDIDKDEIEFKDGTRKRDIDLDDYDDIYIYDPHFNRLTKNHIEEGVLIYAWDDSDDEINIIIVDNTITSTFERARSDYIRVDGVNYDASKNATYSTDENDNFEDYDPSNAGDFIGENVTLVLDINGNYRHIFADVEETSGLRYGIAYDAYESGSRSYVRIYRDNGRTSTYRFENRDDAEDIIDHFDRSNAHYMPIAYKLTSRSRIVEGSLWMIPNESRIEGFDVRYFDSTRGDNFIFDSEDDYIEVGHKRAYIDSNNTVIMKYFENNERGVLDWSDLKNAVETDKASAYVVDDPNMDAQFIVFDNPLSSENEILTFTIPNQLDATEFSGRSITVLMPDETDLSSLIASFTVSEDAQSVEVNGIEQISGSNPNDFTSTVTYVVTAEDGSTKNWIVTVNRPEDIEQAEEQAAINNLSKNTEMALEASKNIVTATINYPESINELLEDWLTDAKITSAQEMPAGTTLSITYNGTPVATDKDISGLEESYLSDLLNEGIPTRPSIRAHEGLEDEWELTVTATEDIDSTITIQSVISKDEFGTEQVIAQDEVNLEIIQPRISLDGIGNETNILKIEFNKPLTASALEGDASSWNEMNPEQIAADIDEDVDPPNKKKLFLDTFFEFKVSIGGTPTIMDADGLVAIGMDLDKVIITGTETYFEIELEDNVIQLTYALDKGNTSVTRMDAEWKGSDTFEAEPPEEPSFKIQFQSGYDEETGTDYTEPTTVTYVASDAPLVRPFITGVENGQIYSGESVTPVFSGDGELSKDEGDFEAFTSGTEITETGNYKLRVTDNETTENTTTVTFQIQD